MTTVKEFRDLGVPFVDGDECRDNTGSIAYAEGWYVYGNAGDKLFDQCKVTHFAWRPLKTLPDNPKFLCDINYGDHSWRPSLDQSKAADSFDGVMEKLSADRSLLTEFKHYEDDEIATQKPVFTQAMADAGDLPPVGSECKFLWAKLTECSGSNQDRTLKVIAYNEDNTIVWGKMNGNKESNLYRLDSLTLKPLDTRTPKQKAVDEIVKMLHSEGVVAFDPIMLHIMYEKGFIKQ